MAELGYFEIGCKKLHFEKKDFKFMNLILRIFGNKLILKHFMDRTIPKMRFPGVSWTAQYVSKVYFTWRRLLLTLLTSFYGYNAFGCIYILLTLKNKKQKISLHQLLYFRDMFLNGISFDFCKKVHFDLILFFHFPVRPVTHLGYAMWAT